jgi:hypothetical protein
LQYAYLLLLLLLPLLTVRAAAAAALGWGKQTRQISSWQNPPGSCSTFKSCWNGVTAGNQQQRQTQTWRGLTAAAAAAVHQQQEEESNSVIITLFV